VCFIMKQTTEPGRLKDGEWNGVVDELRASVSHLQRAADNFITRSWSDARALVSRNGQAGAASLTKELGQRAGMLAGLAVGRLTPASRTEVAELRERIVRLEQQLDAEAKEAPGKS
jgi:hypothetical protein